MAGCEWFMALGSLQRLIQPKGLNNWNGGLGYKTKAIKSCPWETILQPGVGWRGWRHGGWRVGGRLGVFCV